MEYLRSVSWLLVFAAGCAVIDGASPRPNGGGGGSGGDGMSEDGGFTPADGGFTPWDGAFDRDAACFRVSAEAKLGKKPVDIIVIIDNSGSMTEEIESVERNINVNFAQIISNSAIDYRVILIADFHSWFHVCIKPPLGGNICPNGNDGRPMEPRPINTARFFHYAYRVDSYDSLEAITNTYNKPDKFGLAPNGWQAWLRDDALKVFLEITDDRPWPETADQFEIDLFALTPKHFGDKTNRNYVLHSIIGLAENPAGAALAYQPTDPIVLKVCSSGMHWGDEYQKLSERTKGLRFPVCNYASYDAVFQEMAKGVIQGAVIACNFAIPTAPPPYTVDLQTVTLDYLPGLGGAKQTFTQVPSASQCAAGKFYVEKGANKIFLCPDACNAVKQNVNGQLQIYFDCGAPIG